MSVAICLALYSLLLVVVGPPILNRLTRGGQAPALGVALWLAALASVLASWVTATAFLAADVVHTGLTGVARWQACLAGLRDAAAGQHGLVVQAGAVTAVAITASCLWLIGWRVRDGLIRTRRQALAHAQSVRIVGRRVASLDVIVLDGGAAAAYCVADPARTTIVTTGALDALDQAQLEAVLAHERAHLDEHHHLLIAVTRGLAAALPSVPLFTRGAAEIARLLEMRADDVAVRVHGSQILISALAALTVHSGVPAGALGAGAGDLTTRVRRLLSPPDDRQLLLAECGLLTVAVGLLTGPIAIATISAADTGLCYFAAR